MKIRKLNEHGIQEFENYIDNLRRGNEQNHPSYFLESSEYSDSVDLDIEVDGERQFESRYELGTYLVQLFNQQPIQKHMGDRGFWSWLALFWFIQLCPVEKGKLNPSKPYNYILSRWFRHRPRHAIYMTWQLVSLYGEKAVFMLGKEPSIRGELTEQLMARQEILYSKSVMDLANILYSDPQRKTSKPGVTTRTKGGTVTRFISWLDQLRLNYDLYSIHTEDLKEMLPDEYDRFLENQTSS